MGPNQSTIYFISYSVSHYFAVILISVIFQGENNSNVGIESLVAIPYDQWSLNYQQPKPACIRKDGKCIQALFLTPPDSKKV